MLSKPYLDIKRLRSTGKPADAYALLRTVPPATDEDAFEAALCLFVCSDIRSAVNVCSTHAWKTPWVQEITQALAIMLSEGDPAQALPSARRAVANPDAGYDAKAVFLMLLQASEQAEEADTYIQRYLPNPPAGETLLLTVMAEIAASVADWQQAYRHACAVVSADPENFRALITLSLVNHKFGNYHEALGNALRARLIEPQSQQAILQMMRCYNGLSDYYAAIGAFDTLLEPLSIASELHVELGIACAGIDQKPNAITAFHTALNSGTPQPEALRALITLHAGASDVDAVQALVNTFSSDMHTDVECELNLGLERLQHDDLNGAAQRFEASFALTLKKNFSADALPWPIPEPRLRHDCEQLALLAQRGKLDIAGHAALGVIKRYLDTADDQRKTFAPSGNEADRLRHALTALHYRPDAAFNGRALGNNDFSRLENNYFASQPALVVIDNFLSPEALTTLRCYCEEATVWRLNNTRGYVGAVLAQGFSPGVLLSIAHELRQAMPRVIGDHALTQAWAFKYDQRMQGINLHADFAKINVNFWITPDAACDDNTCGGMVVYDLPVPTSWTFTDYNTNQSKMMAYLKMHNAQSTRVPYRENRCVLFDSSLIHITDELHFKPGYENRRVNVTLLYGRARSQG